MTIRKRIFLILFIALQCALIWPVYPLFSDIYPLVLGIPLSFFWVVIMLFAGFFLLLCYHLTDPDRESGNRENPL